MYNCSCGSKNLNFIEANEHWRVGHILSKKEKTMPQPIDFNTFCNDQSIVNPEKDAFSQWLGDRINTKQFNSVWWAWWFQFTSELFKKGK